MEVLAPQCIVCYTDLTHPCVTPCAHNEVCGTCHLRLRYLHSDKKCPICKQENQQIIVDRFEHAKLFEEYPLWGDELGTDFIFRDDVGMFFPKEYYEAHILALFGYHCGVCNNYDGVTVNPDANLNQDAPENRNSQNQQHQGKKNNRKAFTPVKSLLDHLRNKHRLTLCEFCVDHKRDFVALLPRFTPAQLKSHMASGDSADTGFRGHPLCEFCRPKRFYDLTHLHMHLQQDHYKCHVCETQGLANQYFRDYAALEKHFDRQHFLCKDPQCAAARFMVFENEIDLRAHELSVHGGTSTGSTKIQLQFRVRREGYSGAGYESQTVPSEDDFQYGVDGEAFVPEGLPQQERGPNEETSHPLHFQRTEEFRSLAAGIRAAQSATAEEAFPTLGEANAQSEGIRMGWTGAGSLQRFTRPGVATNSVEQFPSLTSASASSGNSNTSVAGKLRAGGVTGSRQFSAMRNAAMGNAPAPASNNWASQAAARPAASDRAQAQSFVHSAAGSNLNRQSDLAENNFPSLGGASQTRASYPTIPSNGNNRTPNAPSIRASDFPSLGPASKTRATYPINSNGANRVETHAPPLNNSMNFPPPPKASTKSNSVRAKLLGERKPAPVYNAANFPPPQSHQSMKQGMITVEEMKASLGLSNYKDLKNLTKQFASDELAPDAYVDRAAALFEGGYGDSDFWIFLPALLVSCPNQTSAAQALRYVDDLRAAHQASTAPSVTSTNWTAPPPLTAPSSSPGNNVPVYGYHASAIAPRAPIRPVGVAMQPIISRPGGVAQQAKNKSAWGGSGASSVVRAKASPVSVTVAAANQAPQSGTATAFMAKETKLQNHQQNQEGHNASAKATPGGGQSKKKKKQSAELRALAFGK